MKLPARYAVPVIAFIAVSTLCAAQDAQSQIKTVLDVQLDAWNRGDIPTLVSTYAPDCVFVGNQIVHGRDQLLARYQKTYPTRQAMGRLSFSAVEISLLDPNVAIVTGEWHLQRSSAGGNTIGGVFSLVFHRKADSWRIALDHTS